MKLRLADDFTLPLDAVTQTFAVLAVRGAGKSNTAAVMAEQMHAAGLPFVVVDPVGSWWGLRVGQGDMSGLPIPVFGGRHGDVPLERGGGQLIADLVVDQRLSCVVDISEFSEGDKIRFLTDFAERLYRRNTDPLHLFLEEADDYIPQRPFKEQARLLRAWENIVRRGRARGLGITLITQRSASINKSVLTQVETLIVLRTTSPQDRKAIQGWVDYHGQSREVIDSLPSLGAGEAWVWSPSYLKICRRLQIHRRTTFDSAATPKDVKGKRPPATLAEVNLAAIREKMAATIERAKAEDPRELRAENARLRKELEAARRATPPAAPPERVEVPIFDAGSAKALESASLSLHLATETIRGQLPQLIELSGAITKAVQAAERRNGTAPARAVSRTVAQRPAPSREVAPRNTTSALKGPEQRVLDALMELLVLGVETAPRVQVALFAGYTNLASKGFANSMGSLRAAGKISYPDSGSVALTPDGIRAANPIDQPRTTEELQERVFALVGGAAARILRTLIDGYPEPVFKQDLMHAAGYTNAASKGFSNSLGRLRSLGLIDYPNAGQAVACPVLFLSAQGGTP